MTSELPCMIWQCFSGPFRYAFTRCDFFLLILNRAIANLWANSFEQSSDGVVSIDVSKTPASRASCLYSRKVAFWDMMLAVDSSVLILARYRSVGFKLVGKTC